MLERGWLGRRVVVRRAAESRGPRPSYRDVLGDLIVLRADQIVIDTRSGPVTVPRAEVASARLVRPAAADVLALELASARGWRAAEVETNADGWLLRADRGWTGRANSALALRTLQRPLADALAAVQTWYRERGLPARIQVPQPAADALGHALGRLGWTAADQTDVLVTRLDLLGGRARATSEVRLDPRPDDDWLAAYRYRGARRPLPLGAAELLSRHDRAVFARVDGVDGRIAAIGRGAVDDGWLGITAVDVDPAHQRQGLGATVVAALGRWGAEAGASRGYAQSDETNRPAHALFETLGWYRHHSYHYRTSPTIY